VKTLGGAVLLVVLIVLFGTALFFVDETEYAIVLRFGQPTQTITSAGLKAKWPWPIENVVRFDRRLMVFDVPTVEEPPREFLTLDKKNIEVSSYTCWQIDDPLRFLEAVGDREGAEAYIRDIVVSEKGKLLGRNNLSALVSVVPEEILLDSMAAEIGNACNEVAMRECGVRIVDFRIKRINYPEQNRNSVFERMRAERKQIATRYRSEGEKEASRIRADADRRRMEILAEATRTALETRGNAEAEAARIYNEAYGKNPDFYRFLRTLESYDASFNEGTTVLLPSSMKYLRTLLEPVR
jgi:membrane protease subunit HflC